MKDQILKIAKVKDEKSFYKKYPTEEAFMAKHSKALKKAAMGTKMVQTQLKQLTDFGNPPIAQDGGMFNIANAIGNAFTTPGKPATGTTGATPASGGLGDTLQGIFGGDSSAFGKANPAGVFGKGGVGKGAGNFSKGLGAGAGQAGLGILNAAPQILEGIGQMKEQKTAIKKANQMSQISGVTAQAAESQDISMSNRKYVRPEDALTQPGQLGSPQGTGTNYLAKHGARIGGTPTEVQNTYNPGDLYSDLGYEPLNDSNVKQFAHGGNLPTAEFGDYFQNSGQASIGKGVGSAIGSAFFGPLGGKVGGFLGGIAGNALGGAKDATQLKGFEDTTKANTDRSAMAAGARSIQSANSSFMRSGGHLAQEYYTPPSERAMQPYENGGYMAMGGDLQLARGKAEPMSYNPFLPDGGETVMFRGPSHADGGMDIQYGQNGVEVEGGEPAVKLQDGGSADDDSLVVFGNMKIDDYAAKEIGDENANGKKYKNYIADLSKIEAKQNKIVNKSTELIELADTNNPFDQLTMNSGRANLIGTDMKLKNIANNKQNAAVVQNAILDTAQERGIDSDALAKGKIKPMKQSDMAKFGKQLTKAQDGNKSTYQLNGRLLDPKDPKDAILIKQNMDDVDKASKSIKDYFDKKNGKQRPKLDQSIVRRTALSAPNAPQQMTRTSPEVVAYREPSPFAGSSNYVNEPTNSEFNPPNFGGASRPSTVPYREAQSQFMRNFKTPTAPPYQPSSFGGSSNYFDKPTASGFTAPNFGGTSRPSIVPYKEAQPQFMQKLKAPSAPQTFSGNPMSAFSQVDSSSKDSKGKFDWKGLAEGAISGLPDFFRPTNQEQLDPNQLMAEQYALGNNQLEPVQAQTYQPMLDQPYDISLQDQINAVDAQANAAIRASGQNPAAQAYIMAQAIEAKNKIKGEEFRANQSNEAQTYQANRAAVNDASLKNLGIYDQQYVRQSEGKSKTKAQTIEALKSISSKVAQNKLENKQLGVMENMYGYRFDSQGRAYNTNNLAQFNPYGNPFARTNNASGQLEEGYEDLFNTAGRRVATRKSGKNETSRNGSIVKALKSL